MNALAETAATREGDETMTTERGQEFYSCYFVENSLILHPYQLFHCCIPVNGKFGSTLIAEYRGGPLPLDAVRRSRERYRQALAENDPAMHCHGCPYRKRAQWNTGFLFTNIHFNHSLLCNLHCQFCVQRPGPIEDKQPRYSALEVARQLVDQRLLSPDAYIFWAGGEPTFLPDFEEALALLMAYGRTRHEIATNGVILSKAIADGLRPDGRLSLKTSVDCGTRDTFRRLKRADRFDQVWRNLAVYASTGGDVGAKYIVTTDNLDVRDLDGFVEHVCTAGIRHAYVDMDHNIPAAHVEERQIAAAAYLYRRLLAAGVDTHCGVHSTGSMPDFPKRVKEYPVDGAFETAWQGAPHPAASCSQETTSCPAK